jgi:hypothetical protein
MAPDLWGTVCIFSHAHNADIQHVFEGEGKISGSGSVSSLRQSRTFCVACHMTRELAIVGRAHMFCR